MIEMPVNRFVIGMTSWLQIQFYPFVRQSYLLSYGFSFNFAIR